MPKISQSAIERLRIAQKELSELQSKASASRNYVVMCREARREVPAEALIREIEDEKAVNNKRAELSALSDEASIELRAEKAREELEKEKRTAERKEVADALKKQIISTATEIDAAISMLRTHCSAYTNLSQQLSNLKALAGVMSPSSAVQDAFGRDLSSFLDIHASWNNSGKPLTTSTQERFR